MTSAGPTIGIDMGGTKCLGLLVDAHGVIIDRERQVTNVDAVIETFAEIAQTLRRRSPEPVLGVGVGVPGLVDFDGVLRAGPHLPGVYNLPVAQRLGAALDLRVVAENDATCATLAESVLGAARDARNAVLITVGTGIGAGFILNGVLHRGAHGFAGELGHMCVQPDGPLCICGRRGCWELYASGQRANAEVTAVALAGDPAAVSILDDLSKWLAVGLANICLAWDPDRIVIGGGVLERVEELIVTRTRAHLAEQFGHAASRRALPEIVAAVLGPDAGAIGAALMARGP